MKCEGIGSIAKDKATGRWSMRRLLTIDMHQLVIGVPDYPTDDWPTDSFPSTSYYFKFVAKRQSTQLWKLHNLDKWYDREEGEGSDPDDYKEMARLPLRSPIPLQAALQVFPVLPRTC